MKLSDISIRNPVFAWMLMLFFIVFGAIGFSRLGVSQLPDADMPILNVSVTLEGASPEVIENSIIDPLEDALMTIEGLKSISASARTGSANLTLEFELERSIDTAFQEVQTKVAQAQRRLPKDAEAAVISKTNPDDQPIIWLAFTYSKNDLQYMNQYANSFLRDRFTTIPGVGDIFLGGYTAPALRVWVKPEALTQYNISVNDIIDAISSEHIEVPGGQVESTTKVFNVRTLGEARNIEEFKNITIARRAGQLIADPTQRLRLSQVADVEEGLDEIRRIGRFNNVPAIGLGIRKQRGSNAVEVARGVKARLEEVRKDLPEGMDLQVNFDTTRFIESSIHELNTHLILAALLTAVVCWVFLGSFSATLNVLLAIPTSIMGAFIGLYFLGFTLNTFTLLGLTLAIGIVVDDAIMVLENIFRYREKGNGRIESAILGSREIAFAAMAASIAVIAIFLPVAFMKGIIGKYFLQFGVTISLAVFLSLIEALTITPMRCAGFVNVSHRTTRIGKSFDIMMEWLKGYYEKILGPVLAHPWKVVISSIIFLAISFFLVRFIPKEFTPAQDQSLFITRLQWPVGTSLQYTNQKLMEIEKWYLSQPEVKQIYATAGGFSGGAGDGNTAVLFVTLVPKSQRAVGQAEFMETARKSIGALETKLKLRVSLQDLSTRSFGGGRGFPIEFMIQGGEWDQLAESSQKIMEMMEKSGMLRDIDSNYLLGMPEIQIRPQREQAAFHGVSISAIGQTVNALIGGVRVGFYSKDGKRNDIRLQLRKAENEGGEIEKLLIGNSRANLIPLSRVVTRETKPTLQQITRVDRSRAISIYANLAPGVSQTAALQMIEQEGKKLLPMGYFIKMQGGSQSFTDSFMSLIFALILGILVAYMVLASQFNSFLDPVTILLAMPFSISGAFFALLVTGQSLNVYSMIGILLLMGIVKKNSIMLVEFANVIRDRGVRDPIEAFKQAGPIRLRPILMTSIATMAAAVPSALALGEGAETFRPMAVTIIGGVFLSTILTLIVIPAAYILFDRLRSRDESIEAIQKAFEKVDHSPAGLRGMQDNMGGSVS